MSGREKMGRTAMEESTAGPVGQRKFFTDLKTFCQTEGGAREQPGMIQSVNAEREGRQKDDEEAPRGKFDLVQAPKKRGHVLKLGKGLD